MNSGVEDKKIAVPNNIRVEIAVKSKKKPGRRYSIRRFASAGMISQVRRPFLYFLAIALVALALCLLAPDKRANKEPMQTISGR